MKGTLDTLTVFAALALLLAACAPVPSASVARSSLARDTAPNVPQADLSALVEGNNTFAVYLYQALRSGDGNLIFSPYSISVALAMPYAGARGQTQAQMAEALHYTLSQERLHPAFNELDLELAKEAQPASQDEHPLQLKIANAVWAEQTFSFLQDYLDTIARNYGAGIQLADFLNQSENVRRQINNWVSGQTNNKVKDLIPAGILDRTTKMVLVNAIYFKADWAETFDPIDTHQAAFTLLDGSQVQVKQMSNSLSGVLYSSGDGWQAVELPYAGNTAAMDLIVPDGGRFKDFEGALSAQQLNQILGGLQPDSLEVSMPKFNFNSSFDLGERLVALGMQDALDPQRADFSGMTGKPDLYITKVLHQAYVAVDEQGTEAAAATSVIMGPTAALLPPKTLNIDRPFIFIIRDLGSGQILFVGRVLDPTK